MSKTLEADDVNVGDVVAIIEVREGHPMISHAGQPENRARVTLKMAPVAWVVMGVDLPFVLLRPASSAVSKSLSQGARFDLRDCVLSTLDEGVLTDDEREARDRLVREEAPR